VTPPYSARWKFLIPLSSRTSIQPLTCTQSHWSAYLGPLLLLAIHLSCNAYKLILIFSKFSVASAVHYLYQSLTQSVNIYTKNLNGLMAECHPFCLFFIFYNIHTFIQSYNTFIHPHSLRPLSISSWHLCSVGKTSLWYRAENRTRVCLTASRRATN
jgi:hypothetical protein